ncbi:LysR family transcriptional regulator [Sphingomonas sp. MAH-20]|jgi:DNA-binding transcriptional LysR family regulator|uniref:LysR family transcriptional regulator n=1 Tax=Sphingomonas horti TaxID=2682842 RepID=A0A6I4J2Q8_9SPHN|nr:MULTISPECIES: LysR family transcriptional regulator [Sphingomonas]MBA2918949.1 LysR family transcriptional regulator [Sphingomonas sp. CGMCC 1.13658]MVO78982.1 LysR family transcriptional regulator [Sphingomonas horti]
MPAWEWSDVRCFLAVARHGATLRAARDLGMNQTTCARRITALEGALGLRLFDKSGSGYQPTPAGQRLVAAGERLADAAAAFEDAATALRRAASFALKLTTVDGFEHALVAPAVAAARRKLPGLAVEIDVGSERRDLLRGEADLAVRAGPEPDELGLVARKLAQTPWGLYRHRDYPAPVTPDNMLEHPIASVDGYPLESTRAMAPHARIVHVTSSLTGLLAALGGADCIAGLPLFIGDAEPDLVRCGLFEGDRTGLWAVYPERLRGRHEIRVLVDCLADQVKALGWRP